MKIVNVIGGLGNQMFQCAFAIALKELYKDKEVFIDTHHYKNPYPKTYRGNNFYHNGFEVSELFPNFNVPRASACQIIRVSYYVPNYFLSRIVRKFLPTRKSEYIQGYKEAYVYDESAFADEKKQYFEGYWLTPRYFNSCVEKIQDAFTFKPFNTQENKQYASILAQENSVTIHIRRGDYLNGSNVQGICTLEYYRKAITEAKKHISDPVFFIFSNDQNWCMENLKSEFGSSQVFFVTNNKGNESYRDMQLMSLARCNILANSSFSWWGAYLNRRKDQIVYVPSKWIHGQEDDGAYVETWNKII